MPYDEKLANRVRDILEAQPGLREQKMFGGLCYMLHGNMAVGVETDRLMVRVGPHAYERALAKPHARPMDLTGRPMKGIIWVDAPGIRDKRALRRWIQRGLDFAASLPPKQSASSPNPRLHSRL